MPACYGRNLDALEECLLDLDGSASVTLRNATDLIAALGVERLGKFDSLFRDIADEREGFAYAVQD